MVKWMYRLGTVALFLTLAALSGVFGTGNADMLGSDEASPVMGVNGLESIGADPALANIYPNAGPAQAYVVSVEPPPPHLY